MIPTTTFVQQSQPVVIVSADAYAKMVAALKLVARDAEALIGEANWYASNQAPQMMKAVREALKAAA